MSESEPLLPIEERVTEEAPVPPPSLVPPPDMFVPASFVRATRSERPRTLPPAPLRSLPPLPAIEPVLEQAAVARAKGDWDLALEHYKKALFLVSETDAASQASLYAYVAEVKLAQGKTREAETNFEKALAARPKHLRSIDSLIALATRAEEWPRVAVFRKKRAEALEDEDERLAELCRVADVFDRACGEPRKAVATLEAANAAHPGDAGVLGRLERLHRAMREWPKLLQVLDDLCRGGAHGTERGGYRFAQAEIVLGFLRDEPRGLAFLELALDEDPQNDRALSALVIARTRREEWAELAVVYERVLARLVGVSDRERAWEIARKLGVLRRDRLLDGPGAAEAMRAALDWRPDDVETRAALAELYAAKGERGAAVSELETATLHAPTRVQTYRRLYDLHTRAQRPDRAWLVATCLEELGALEIAHELAIEQFRPAGPIRPTTALDGGWWEAFLGARGADPIVTEILLAISGAAIALRLEELAARKMLPALDPAAKQDKTSTASVVRTLRWAARALGIAPPDLYLVEDVPDGIAAMTAATPSVALGPSVRSGKTVQQLAFFAGRHLTYYRPEHYALVFFPTLGELSALVLAAIRLVIPSISLPPPPDPESKVTLRLGSRLTPEQKAALERAVARLDARGGTIDLLAWMRHVELTAARAGLLLAGDLRVAMRILKEEARSVAELSPETTRGDLLAFCAADAYGTLRERMGIAIHMSRVHVDAEPRPT